jgi:hypothetical protein
MAAKSFESVLFRAELVLKLLVEFEYEVVVPVGHRIRNDTAQFRDAEQSSCFRRLCGILFRL